MVDNRGNAYRTRGAISAAIVLIGAVVAMLAYFAAGVGGITALGIFVAILAIAILAVAPFYSGSPDKFGPGERDYRLAMGLLVLVIGIALLVTGSGLEWYWAVAIVVIGIAVIGIVMALVNNRKIYNE
jgi:membrane protein YdbS with pleckstrin-like domain